MSKKLESYTFLHVPSEVLVILIVVLPFGDFNCCIATLFDFITISY